MLIFRSIPPYVDKKEIEANLDAYDNMQKDRTRPSRKKKVSEEIETVGSDCDEPVNKKPKKRQLLQATIDLCNTPKEEPESRSLRVRRTKKNGKVVIDDEEVSEKECRDIQMAINASLKAAGGAAVIPDLPKIKKKPKVDPYEHIDKTIELFHYPLSQGYLVKEITVKMEDYLCLGKAEYLSDVIIDFYFAYIFAEKFTPEMREKVHVFPSQFYSYYSTSSDYPGWNSEENANKTALQKRYERIEGMLDPNVNYFDKDFLVFPLFQTNHWFLSIVCYPKLTQNLSFSTNEPTDDEAKRNLRHVSDPAYALPPLKSSCILTFDSVKSNSARKSTAMKHIRGFLTSHYERRYKDEFQIGKLTACSVLVSFNVF